MVVQLYYAASLQLVASCLIFLSFFIEKIKQTGEKLPLELKNDFMKRFLILCFLLNMVVLLSAQEESIELEEEVVEEEYDSEEEFSDEDYVPMFSLGISLDVGVPMGNFNDNLDGIGLGFGGNFLIRTNRQANVPVLAGLSGGLIIYDSESQDQIILIDGATINGRLTTRNSIFMMHGVFRILPPVNSSIQPFIDGLVGFKNFYTRTTLEDLDAFEDDTIESYIEQGDWAFSFGGAAGVQWLVGGGWEENFYLMLEARCSYLKGSAANYLVRIDDPNLQIVDTIDAFEEKNSTTDILIPSIGVSFVF